VLLGVQAAQPGGEGLDRDPAEYRPVRLLEHPAQHHDIAAAALVGHPGREVDGPAEVVEPAVRGHRDRRAVMHTHLEGQGRIDALLPAPPRDLAL
jgi:hypothetical protein